MINAPLRNFLSFRLHSLRLLPFVSLLLLLLFAVEAQAAISITATRTSSPYFYTNSDAGTASTSPKCNYLSFDIQNNGAAIDDVWVQVDNFSGYLSLGGGDNGISHFGPMDAGEIKPAFFYVCSSYTGGGTVAAEGYTVTTYSGKPLAGGDSDFNAFTTTIDDGVIQANPNQVNAIWADINPSILGATTTLTVDGDTGTVGCTVPPSTCTGSEAGPLSFNPATFTDWRADAYELVASSIVLSVGNTGTHPNTLYIDKLASSSTTHYVVTYYFRPVSTTESTTTLSPVSYISSGTQIKHTALNKGAYAAAGGLLPILPAVNKVSLTKSVSHATLPEQGGVVTYTLSATNSGGYALSLDSFIDTLPAGASYVPDSTTFNNVSFPDPVVTGSELDWSSLFDIPAYSTRSLIFQATLPATPGTYTNAATALVGNAVIDTTLSTSDYVPATASTVVLSAPTISKAFWPTALAIGTDSTLTLTITNPNTAHILNGIAVSDTLPAVPAGLVFSTPPDAATTCSGAALNISGTTISITGGTLTVGQSCTVSVKVTSSINNSIYTNITDAVSSSNGGIGGTASATLSFTPKPTISKAFSVATIPVNDSATMSFTIINNTAAAITGMTFGDTYPVNLVNAATLNLTNTCGGTVTAVAGGGSLSLSGGGIAAAGDSCSISIDVTSATAGDYDNTTSGVDSVESTPVGPVSNTATLSVLAPPTVTKAFSPSTIGKGQTSTLTVELTNPNATAITGAAFTDTYPAGLDNATTTNLTNSCGGTAAALAGDDSLSLSGGIIPAGGSCEISVDVTSAIAADYINTLAIGAVTTSNAGSSTAAVSDTLTVNTTPTVEKSFSFDTSTGIAMMNVTITNNDAAAITGLSFYDLFPTGMKTDDTPSVSPAEPCGTGSSIESWDGTTVGTLSATGGDQGIKLTAGQIAGSGSCSFSINLSVNALGVYNNQITDVTGSFGVANDSNIAIWVAPSVGKSFTPTQVTPTTLGPSDISRLVITITNPSSTMALTGLTINDIYPTTATKLAGGTLNAAITAASPADTPASNSCGGTFTATSTGMSLSGGVLAAGASCSIAADVLAVDTTPAIYVNTTDNVTSDQGVGISGGDTLIITTKPTIDKSFVDPVIELSGGTATSVMRIVVENNSGMDITDVEFSDIFPTSPSQMVWVSTDANGCGGTLTDDADAALVSGSSTSIKLTAGVISSLAPATCTIDITVSVSAAGTYDNTTTGAISSVGSEVGPVSNTAQLVANLAAPTVTKVFANAGFQVNNANRLTITLTNPNTEAITSVAFTDTYPANMVNAPTPNIVNTCGGTATAAAGAGILNISGATIPASSSCTVEVDLTATAAGAYTNTLLAAGVTSANANAGPAADVTADTKAYLPPTLSKSFGAATLSIGSSTTLVLTLTNPVSNPDAITDVRVDDTFPTDMILQNTTFSYAPAACGSVTKIDDTASVAGDDNIRFNVALLAAGVSCELTVNIISSTSGAVTNTTDVPVATAAASSAALTGTTAWASIIVQSSPSITVLKSVLTLSDPVNLMVNPKAIPGAVVQYTIISTNSGEGSADNDSTVVVDPIPANTLLYVDDIGGAGSGPVLLTQGATSSTLIYSFIALDNGGDDLSFSNDGGIFYNATPTFDAVTGCDTTAPAITHIRVNPKGTFIGDVVPPSPSFLLSFRVCIQ